MSYFSPVITINTLTDGSQFVGITTVLLLAADVNRIGFILQNNSPNDLWWGYDAGVTVNGSGYFCLEGGSNRPFIPPPNGVHRGDIYAVSDGGSQVTAKAWIGS